MYVCILLRKFRHEKSINFDIFWEIGKYFNILIHIHMYVATMAHIGSLLLIYIRIYVCKYFISIDPLLKRRRVLIAWRIHIKNFSLKREQVIFVGLGVYVTPPLVHSFDLDREILYNWSFFHKGNASLF